ncbi:MAG: SET domain-containing protein [Pseudomonas sp.]|nr:MAG: SET domain-containing protein [Pseudomonas sp.]
MTVLVAAHSIEVRTSRVHGRGVYASRRLPKGTFIGLYEGRRYTSEQLLKVDWHKRHGGMTYLFGLSDGMTIDGAQGGNATRFLNHCCEPNCEAVEVIETDGCIRLRVVSTKTIATGTELFIDYALTIDESETPAAYGCRCGALSCRGSMAAMVVKPTPT